MQFPHRRDRVATATLLVVLGWTGTVRMMQLLGAPVARAAEPVLTTLAIPMDDQLEAAAAASVDDRPLQVRRRSIATPSSTPRTPQRTPFRPRPGRWPRRATRW